MKFIITVDTEADNQWKSQGEIQLENLKAIPRFQQLCEKYDFPPTYLVTYEVASSDAAVAVLRPLQEKGLAEIGTHLHPWTTPPYFNEAEEKKFMHFPCELSDEMLRKKFITLHERVTERFGRPTSFRAGRWGYDKRVESLLIEYGYHADCSITPFVNWKRVIRGGEDRNVPSFLDESPRCSQRGGVLRELPMTILPKDADMISRIGATILNKGSFRVRWCRIFPETTADDLIAVYQSALRRKLPYVEFMVHSSEFIAGGSPYSKTQELVEHFFTTFEMFAKFLRGQDVEGTTLSQAATGLAAER